MADVRNYQHPVNSRLVQRHEPPRHNDVNGNARQQQYKMNGPSNRVPGGPPHRGPGPMYVEQPSVVPTSQMQNMSIGSRNRRSPVGVKNPLLKYDVVPPKKTGPSEAEKKVNELTQKLEEEMADNPEGDDFGKNVLFNTLKIILAFVIKGFQKFLRMAKCPFPLIAPLPSAIPQICPLLSSNVPNRASEVEGRGPAQPLCTPQLCHIIPT